MKTCVITKMRIHKKRFNMREKFENMGQRKEQEVLGIQSTQKQFLFVALHDGRLGIFLMGGVGLGGVTIFSEHAGMVGAQVKASLPAVHREALRGDLHPCSR